MRKFMKTRGAATPAPQPPPPPADTSLHHTHSTLKTNGHANGGGATNAGGAGAGADQHISTLSRYWSGSEASAALWEDAEFPAARRSLGDAKLGAVQWRRPHEMCARPTFRGDSADESDEQECARWSVAAGSAGSAGSAGDPNLCVAAAALALTPRLLDRVAPPQTFRPPYCGAFRFKFWVFGAWREVRVDDRLPTRGGVLLSSRGALHDDFTLPLLEKAYAKLYGSYAALRGGSVARALQDLSGGIVQSFSLALQPRALTAQVLNSAVPRSTLLVAAVGEARRRGRAPLPPGRAYCVTGLARVRGAGAAGGEGALVRVRAVGGARWCGAWSRGSAEWCALPDADREVLARRADRPGDFWMSFGDFCSVFCALVLVHVGPDDWLSEAALHGKRPWRAVLARRRWRRGYNAGGPPSCIETTGTNPQFHVQIPRAESGGASKCHVVVSVTQQYDVAPSSARTPHLHAIGFAVYELPPGASPRRPLAGLRALDVTHECRAREVVTFFTLPPGQYLVVPHTRRPHTDAAFLLRILTDEQTHVWEVNEDNLIVHDLASEFPDEEQNVSAETRAAAARLLGGTYLEEVDAARLRGALRGGWWAARVSGAACAALVALRDGGVRGWVRGAEVPALAALVRRWRAVWASGRGACGGVSSYALRGLLRAAGVCASNKVVECAVVRYCGGARVSADAFVLVLARLHLAHERYRNLDAKMKSNPLSLEEMILMTIYS